MSPGEALLVKLIVYGGWLFSLSLHEFAHGFVAYLGGDRGIKRRGYLTLNPLRFMNSRQSFLLPMLFLLLGGLGLPGGATYIDPQALRSKGWETAVSLAGPAANLLIGGLIGLLFGYDVLDPETALGAGFACLAGLQFGAMLFNLIPFPPLNGFGALRPHLSPSMQAQGQQLNQSGYMLLILLFWFIPGVSAVFWHYIYIVADVQHVPAYAIYDGFQAARFW